MIDLFADDCSPLTGLRRLALAHLVAKFRATWPGLAAAAGLPAGRPGAVREVIAHRAFYQIGTYIYLSAWARRELARAARCLAYVVMRPGLVEVLLPYFQDADPILASALAGLVGDAGRSRALADGLAGAAAGLLDGSAASLDRGEARVSVIEDDGAAD
jgi:hypothetical protein